MTTTDLITTEEAAVMLGCSARTVRRRVAAGDLTPIRRLPGPAGSLLLLRADVARLAAEQVPA